MKRLLLIGFAACAFVALAPTLPASAMARRQAANDGHKYRQ